MHVSSEEVAWASRQSEMACLDSTLTKILAQRVCAEAAKYKHETFWALPMLSEQPLSRNLCVIVLRIIHHIP